MSKLTSRMRNSLSKEVFGLPAEKKYPMPDRSHAANAKSRASEMYHEGNLSYAKEQKIDRKADRILGK